MPEWAATILRSTCESAAARLAAYGHLDLHDAREFVHGLVLGTWCGVLLLGAVILIVYRDDLD